MNFFVCLNTFIAFPPATNFLKNEQKKSPFRTKQGFIFLLEIPYRINIASP